MYFHRRFIITFPNFWKILFISLIKDSSLAFSVSIVEMIGKAKIISASGLDIFEAYIVVSGIYWVVCIIVEKSWELWKEIESRWTVE